MANQKRIDEYFKSSSNRRNLNNIKKNCELSVTPRTPNEKKRKRLQSTEHAIKHPKSSQLSLDDDRDGEIIFQENNTLCYEKENIDKYISLSESNISYDPTTSCAITYDSAEESKKEMNGNDTCLRAVDTELEYDNGVLENTPIKKQATCDKNISPIANSNSSPSKFSLDDDSDVEIIFQENNTLCYEKENIDKHTSLSESNISYDPTTSCAITYDSAEESKKEMNGNDTCLRAVDTELEYDNGVLENIPIKKQATCDTNISPIANSNSSPSKFSLDDDSDVEIIFQENNTLCYEKENIDKHTSLSESNISYDPITFCAITYDSAEESKKEMNGNDTCLRAVDTELEYDNGVLKNTPIKKQATCDKNISPIANSNSSPSKFRKSKYSPKTSSNISPNKRIAQRLFDDFVNIDVAKTVIEHMNLVKQGAIPPNDFNMEEIYSNDTFKYHYGQINTKASVKYELNNVNLPKELNARILIGSILTVLSKPYNCSYFEENELDFIYCILTLSEKAQMLLARMIKRIKRWHRKDSINYPHISSNLKDVFDLLESRSICTYDLKDENLADVLDLLQVKELNELCRSMKIKCKGKKEIVVDNLIKFSKKKTLFPGMKSPSNALYDCIFKTLDCVRITNRTWDIIDTIMTLLLPNEDPEMSMSDIFFKLGDIYLGNTVFPRTPKNHFPLFSCRSNLLTYVKVKSTLSTVLNLIEKGDWEKVQMHGNTAMKELPNILRIELLRLENSILPMHVRKFLPGYVWLKILSKSIDAFKRKKDMATVVNILNFLIKQNCHMNSHKGKWYCELALVKMHHDKDIDSSASVIIEALDCEYLSQVDKVDLLRRAERISNRKTGVKSHMKTNIYRVLNTHYHEMCNFTPASNIISAVAMPRAPQGGKSTWLIKSSDQDDNYGTVETVALYHYKEQNFPKGIHCEGNLPILLFTTLFWEELYENHIPGAFMTPYAIAPADLYTKHFYENRKRDIDKKLRFLDSFNRDPASFSSWMEKRFENYKQYQSLMPRNLLPHSIYMKEIVYCLGVQGVARICKRMTENFKLWSAGFPDLIVWNYDTREHKIVEVKGPKDVLSTKQLLWLEYLNESGLNIEVCLVQDKKCRDI